MCSYPLTFPPSSSFPFRQIGYKVIRMYWGMRTATKRCQYVCSIHDANGKPEFRIAAQEPGHEDIAFVDSTTKGKFGPFFPTLETNSNSYSAVG